jgi:hypothetical protein
MSYFLNCALLSFNYVTSDPFFWASMAFTTMVGAYVGAVIHDGDLKMVGKTVLSLFCYALLITAVNITRVVPTIADAIHIERPFAPTVTVFLVTLFYLFGMSLGVVLVKKAHKNSGIIPTEDK